MNSEDKLNLFYEKGKNKKVDLTDEDHHEVFKHIKDKNFPNVKITSIIMKWTKENNIKCLCAPFEAEWQCVHLECMSVADTVMSSDGYCIMHGVKNLCYE